MSTLTLDDLIEFVEDLRDRRDSGELTGNEPVQLAYQPHYALTTGAQVLDVVHGVVYIAGSSSNEYLLGAAEASLKAEGWT